MQECSLQYCDNEISEATWSINKIRDQYNACLPVTEYHTVVKSHQLSIKKYKMGENSRLKNDAS